MRRKKTRKDEVKEALDYEERVSFGNVQNPFTDIVTRNIHGVSSYFDRKPSKDQSTKKGGLK